MDVPLSIAVELVNDKVRFSGSTRGLPPVSADYFPPLGDSQGYTGLELLLLSLAVCSGTAILPLLRRMGKTVAGLRVSAAGKRRDRHPTSFERIDIEFALSSPDAAPADLQKAVSMAEGTICPVWAMLKGSCEIVPALRIVAP
ncbi:MAG TPA: OsmC family protein [Candidatus Aminicenantes bacterium]|nr:OsmC family protein [Candidatus Aminicenantes bacterium]